jgi:peptidoglycan/LPS O-acetylase OafA/YrhL
MDRHCLWILIAWCTATAVLVATGPDAIFSEIRKILLALLIAVLVCRIDKGTLSGPNVLAALGRAGYSVYAFHAPLMYSLAIYHVPWWLNIGCCIALGLFAYVIIERPFINVGRYVLKHWSPTLK